MNPTNLMTQVEFASRTIRLDEASALYIVTDSATGDEIGRFETYKKAMRAR